MTPIPHGVSGPLSPSPKTYTPDSRMLLETDRHTAPLPWPCWSLSLDPLPEDTSLSLALKDPYQPLPSTCGPAQLRHPCHLSCIVPSLLFSAADVGYVDFPGLCLHPSESELHGDRGCSFCLPLHLQGLDRAHVGVNIHLLKWK